MTEQEWLTSTDPQALLAWLLGQDWADTSHRKLRLFACACVQVMGSRLYPAGIVSAEAFAAAIEGRGHHAAMEVDPASLATTEIGVMGRLGGVWANQQHASLLRCLVGNPFRPVIRQYGPSPLLEVAAGTWKPPAYILPDSVFTWHDGTVPRLAREIYEDRRFADLPILADALEEAGCTDEAILQHCRADALHARGCWVLDLLLGKS